MITAVGICRAKKGQEEELGRRMKQLVAPTSTEAGCVRYDLYRSETDPAIWVFFEQWQSVAALDAHVQSAHFQAFLAAKDDVLEGVPDNYRLSLVMPSSPSRR
jgi:quinol monooxygenase YgiN